MRKPKIFHWCLLDAECRDDAHRYGAPYRMHFNRLKWKGRVVSWVPPLCHNRKRAKEFWGNTEPVSVERKDF